jgi:hypothetical protein
MAWKCKECGSYSGGPYCDKCGAPPSLKTVPVVPFCCCMPWHCRQEGEHGAACWFCDRAVAAPEKAHGKIVSCIYCGLDRGFIPEIEVPPEIEVYDIPIQFVGSA